VITSLLDETRRFLDSRIFHGLQFSSSDKADTVEQTQFLNGMESQSKDKHVVVLESFNTMSSVAGDIPICLEGMEESASM